MSTITNLIRTSSPEEAVEAYTAGVGTTLYLSGGTILVHAGASIDTAVDICRIGADAISLEPDGTLVLGACTHIGDLARSPEAAGFAGGILATAARGIANHTIRNLATVGGNVVAWHFPTDLPPVLLALDATLQTMTREGARQFPLESFYASRSEVFTRGDLMTALRIPNADAHRGAFHKVGRKRLDVAIASAAAVVGQREAGAPDVRLALGALGVAPSRARVAEGFLAEHGLSAQTVRDAAGMAVDAARPRGDRRASARYRRDAAIAAAVRVLTEASGLEG